MKLFFTLVFALGVFVAQAQNFTSGNIVVSQVGNGTAPSPNTNNVAITLLEYLPSTANQATPTKTVSIPSTGTDKITTGYAAVQEGQLTLSQDGKYLMVLGYNADPNQAFATHRAANKVIGRIDKTGAINSSTNFTTSAATSARMAVSVDGNAFWTTINNIGYVTLGQTTTPTQIVATAPRLLNIFNNQLYYHSAFSNIFNTATPLPPTSTTGSAAVTLGTSLSSLGFVFFDLDGSISWNGTGYDVVYVTNTNAGLEKYYYDGSAWIQANSQYVLTTAVTNGGSGYTTATATIGNAWVANATYAVNAQVTNAGRVYNVSTAGTAGTVAPTHTTGTVAATGGTASFAHAGVNITGNLTVSGGAVTAFTYTGSSPYIGSPPVVITGDGTGATATALSNAYNGGFGALAQMTGKLVSGVPVLYAIKGSGTTTGNGTTSTNGTANNLIAITDNSGRTAAMVSAVLTPYITLASPQTGYAFRGLAFSPSVTLGVELTTFTAKCKATTAQLSWTTASEKDNAVFNIEQSTNGTDFQTVGEVKGKGTTNAVSNYSFEHTTPSVGVNYYRLKQVDFNGTATYSAVQSVVFGKNGLIVKTTLVHDALDVIVSDETTTPLSIFNIAGQQVFNGKAQGTQRLDVSALPSGLYIIRTGTGDVGRFVKQ